MAEFIMNPRRAPRAPARCRAVVVSPQGSFEAETEDIGSMGCQLVSPKLVRRGEAVRILVTNEKVDEPLETVGHVAWVSPQPPWRVGIAFDEGAKAETVHWFDQLVAAHPGLGGYRRVPDRIRADSMIYLGPPPRFLLDFTAPEAMLLRAIASGARIDELMVRLRDRWPAAQRALFSLIARQVVTFQRGQAAHPDAWKKVLHDVEASLALEQLGEELPAVVAPAPPPVAPAAPAARPADRAPARVGEVSRSAPPAGEAGGFHQQAHAPSPLLELLDDGGPPLELDTPAAPGASAETSRAWPGAGSTAGGGSKRSPEAQAAFDRALQEHRAGSVIGAISHLRRALQLAPGDPEITQVLGRLAAWDRGGPQ